MKETKLALSEEILMNIEKPARYIGGEVNMSEKYKENIDIRFCMCFPDVYEIGMSHLGIQILYDMFNKTDGVSCERVYSPWPDLDRIMREKNIPLFSLESQRPIKEFDFLGITLQYEMCYTNILQILDLSGIPLFSKDRTEEDPIVIGGGPCSYNPEPIADFFDIFYLGEGETRYAELLMLYRQCRREKLGREEFLKRACRIPGIYVPSLYSVDYNDDGTIKSFEPLYDFVPSKVKKEVEMNMSDTYYPEKPLIPNIQAVQDRATLEIQRGCIRGCRFCQAGMIYRPIRERSLEFLKDKAKKMLDSTGYEEITLSSLSSSDYSKLKELVYFLIDEYSSKNINIALPSLRIDAFALDVMSKVQDINKSSVTFAPEAGSQRMRDTINKGLTKEDILKGSKLAFEGGWNKVKLYFMLGLPTETEEDARDIARMANDIAVEYYEIPKDQRNGKVSITISTSFFVPKPFTPFQWTAMASKEEYLSHKSALRDELGKMLNARSIKYNWHDSDTSELEGVFARGDRRLAAVIYDVYSKGCIFDAWVEYFKYDVWEESIRSHGLSFEFYNRRERSYDEILPWDFIDAGVSRNFLKREYENAKKAVVTPNCREKCSGCGAAGYGGGVCFESKN
ncbi:MAG: TIGR03960 family B12-binding radical SAM protein [Lachnospiraceae bacterium]|nr:TIGR03960 family B12-binding radical SAM protein [Lachnospiraceae bacterium]